MRHVKKFIKSLRFVSFILILIFGITPSILLRVSLLNSYETRAVENRTVDVTGQAKLMASRIVSSGYLANPEVEPISTQLVQFSTIYDGRIMLIDHNFKIVKDTYDLDTGKTIISQEVIQAYQGEDISKYDSVNRYVELAIPLTDPENGTVAGVMLVSVSTDIIMSNQEYLYQSSQMVLLIICVLIVALALGISNQITIPLKRLSKSIKNVVNGNLEEDVTERGYTEIVDISTACNNMLRRARILEESRQEFVSNVSHELKTPLTSMKVLSDSLVGQIDAPIEMYQEFMTDIAAEIDRENKIINDLLSLVKLDKSASVSLNIESVNINEMLELLMKRLRPIAKKQNVELVLESFRPVIAEIDEVKFTLAISNLIENAIKYNRSEGWVHVSLNADHQYFFIKVEDSGIGIPEDQLEYIYTRFYRVDKSHSREIGGTGLGLAITRNAVSLHKGTIKVHSVEGEGTTFIVRIPLNYIA